MIYAANDYDQVHGRRRVVDADGLVPFIYTAINGIGSHVIEYISVSVLLSH